MKEEYPKVEYLGARSTPSGWVLGFTEHSAAADNLTTDVFSGLPWDRAAPQSTVSYWWGRISGCDWQAGSPPYHGVPWQRLKKMEPWLGLATKTAGECIPQGLPARVQLAVTPQKPMERKQHETRNKILSLAVPRQCLFQAKQHHVSWQGR